MKLAEAAEIKKHRKPIIESVIINPHTPAFTWEGQIGRCKIPTHMLTEHVFWFVLPPLPYWVIRWLSLFLHKSHTSNLPNRDFSYFSDVSTSHKITDLRNGCLYTHIHTKNHCSSSHQESHSPKWSTMKSQTRMVHLPRLPAASGSFCGDTWVAINRNKR